MDEQWKKLTQYQVEAMNAEIGTLQDGFDCPICRNKGYVIYADDNGAIHSTECECMGRRNAVRAVKATGADNLLSKHSFAEFDLLKKPLEVWQQRLYDKALEFSEKDTGLWFVGGQTGAGKTMTSVAILNRLLERGKNCKYFVWGDLYEEVKRLMINDDYAYEQKIKELSKIEVLYLDDFIREEPTSAEIKFAFKIINNRYMSTLGGEKMLTLISSQRTMLKILSLEEAIGGRICEIGGDYVISISDDPKKNWRMRNNIEKIKKNTL